MGVLEGRVCVITAQGCPFTAQVFSVVGTTIGIYGGWSIAAEVSQEDRWRVDELIGAMADLPHTVEVKSQKAALIEAMR